jgi:ATP-dependent Lhr-like helicase
MSAFLLAGRAWLVEHINHPDKLVRVRPAPGGKKPIWGGFVPALLGFELCQRMKKVLTGEEQLPYLEQSAEVGLRARRAELGDTLRRPIAIQNDEGLIRWWTFAGGRINHTLKYAIELRSGWKVVADNFNLKISGDGVSDTALRQCVAELARAEFWERTETQEQLLARLPEYRLSKFQQALPDRFAVEMVGGYLLDVEGTLRFLRGLTLSN